MKILQDTGWDLYTLRQKSIEKLENVSKGSSNFTSLSNLHNFWSKKHSRRRKKRDKRHRFPPSLLSSRVADFWDSLMPLRADCSCSSVSVLDTCSRFSFDVSTSNESNVVQNSESSFSTVKQTATPVRSTLGDTLRHTHSAFELLIARMTRLLNILNEKSDSLSTLEFSSSNLKILKPEQNSNSNENTEFQQITRSGYRRFPSFDSFSTNSGNDCLKKKWTDKKWQSFSNLEITEQKKLYFRRGSKSISRASKNVSNKDELVYLLRYKKSLLSEYFHREEKEEENSINLQDDFDTSCDRKNFIHVTQSDSRARKKRDTEDFDLSRLQKSEQNFSVEDCSQHLLTPKRRVTFKVLYENENEDISAQILSSTKKNISEISLTEFKQSEEFLVDSKFTSSPTSSLVNLKACNATLILNSLCKKICDETEKTVIVCKKNSKDKNSNEFENVVEEKDESMVEKSEILSIIPIAKNSYVLNESSNFVIPKSQKFIKSENANYVKIMENEIKDESEILTKETSDFPNRNEFISNDSKPIEIQKIDDENRRNKVEKCLKRKIYPIENGEDCESFQDDFTDRVSNYELESEFVRSKITRLGNIQETEISVKCDEDLKQRSLISSGKTVKFKDCSPAISDQLICNDDQTEELDVQRVFLSESKGWFEFSWKGCWEQEFKMLDHEKPSGLISASQSNNETSFPSSFSQISEPSILSAVAACSLEEENDETISFSESNYVTDFKQDSKTLQNISKGIRNPEIWRAEVQNLYELDEKLWQSTKKRNDWLIQRLEELKSYPETDYESDYEIDSDFNLKEDSSRFNRSFSKLNACYEKYKKFAKIKNRFRPTDSFLHKVLSGRNIIFNECQCNKKTSNRRGNLKLENRANIFDYHHSDKKSNKNIVSHLEARFILDSETDDSDFTSSNKSDFSYNQNHKQYEHVNKIKCRRFVRSLRSIESEEDRSFSSPPLLNVTFEKSFSPASVQSVFSTRNVGTNFCEKKQHFSTANNNKTDVCTDTSDLCALEAIETTINQRSADSSLVNETIENSIDTLDTTKVKKIGSVSQIPEKNERRIANAFENLSAQINNASNNLAKLRFSEIKTVTEPTKSDETLFKREEIIVPVINPCLSNSSKICTNLESNVEKSLGNGNNVDFHNGCPICKIPKKLAGRYLLPACKVKGLGPDLRINEKDPWNRVMKQAKGQIRDELGVTWRTSSSFEPTKFVPSYSSSSSNSHDRNSKSVNFDKSCMKESAIKLVQVKNNSSQANAVDYELKNTSVLGKIRFSPTIKLPRASAAIAFSTSNDFFGEKSIGLPRKKSPRRNDKNTNSRVLPNNIMSTNRLLYIISEKSEPLQKNLVKLPVAKFFN